MTQNQNNPYLLWAGEPSRYVFQWNAGQGGVLPAQAYQARAPRSSLGAADMLESGYGDPNFIPDPQLRKVAPYRYCPPPPAPCGLRAQAAAELNGLGAVVTLGPRGRHTLGDWPQIRPQGFEPGWMATGSIPVWDDLGDTGKMLALVALGAGALWWLSRSHGGGPLGLTRRRNPWAVRARHKSGVTGQVIIRRKKAAMAYADDLRKSKKHSRVRVSRY